MDNLRSLFARLRFFRGASVFVVLSLLIFPAATGAGGRVDADFVATGADLRPAITLFSHAPERAPRMDGVISYNEWQHAASYALPHGTLYLLNDTLSLYLLIDLTADTHADNPASPPFDYFSLTFDVNANGMIDAGVDVMLGFQSDGYTACRQKYLGPNVWIPCLPSDSTLIPGWGATPASATAHRFYEVAISRAEISPSAAVSPWPALPSLPAVLRMGVQTFSAIPAFNDLIPAGHQADFSQLIEVNLDQPVVKLLILCYRDDCNALQALKEHKDYTAMPSYILDWETVARAYHIWGHDDPERIKKALAAYEANAHTQYALLVGDANRFPIRYTITDRPEGSGKADWAFYSADLYYADLYEADHATFEDWDANDDYYYGELHGERITGIVNVDQVDASPDIAVGRVPASTTAEVTTFVNKVINYEINAYKSAWSRRALMISTRDWIAGACNTKDTIGASYLAPKGYTINKLYQSGGTCPATDPPSSANINTILNQGAGFVNYLGHGAATGWAIPGDEYNATDLAGLTNQNMLPIAVSGGCGTARYTAEPPYDAYLDMNGAAHIGTNAGETFVGKPVLPAPLQTGVYNLDAFVEEMLVENSTGSVGYIGYVTGSQDWVVDLDTSFFESLAYNWDTLGGMWNFMVDRYYQINPDPGSLVSPDWFAVAGYHQPWKFHLFGDPSLRIHGVSAFQKDDFAGEWWQNHDGWPGTLTLQPEPDDFLSSMPNLTGTHAGGLGSRYAYGYVRTWSYPIPETPDWPDYMMRFFIDFNNTPSSADDQQFDGYLFTHDRTKMAGITWWSGTPFGFLSLKSESDGGYPLVFETASAPAIFPKSDFLGVYTLVHDGWQGQLTLIAQPDDPPHPNITGTYRDASGNLHAVRAYVRTSSYAMDPGWGPDHKIEMYIDFADTPSTTDDQLFNGYLFTQSKRAIAGLTYWSTNPYGFYAIKVDPVYLPLMLK